MMILKIWHDKWIPRDGNFRIQSPPTFMDPDSLVKNLIELRSLTWNEDLVYSTFSKDEADLICSLPLSKAGVGDTLVWHYDKKGHYNVKSGYRMLCSLNASRDDDVQDHNISAPKNFWESLWKTEVPNKLKVFAWKLTHEALPSMVNLFKRGIQVDKTCFRCSLAEETTLHAVLKCEQADNVWRQMNFLWPLNSRLFTGVRSWMAYVMPHLDAVKKQQFLLTAWAIWNGRNGELHGEHRRKSQEVAGFIHRYAEEYNAVQIRTTEERILHHHSWEAPSEGIYKVNFDAALDMTKRRGCVGIIIRDFKGEVIGACISQLQHVVDPFAAEALGAVKALEFAADCGLSTIILEGDALGVIRKLSSMDADLSTIGPIIDEARSRLLCFAGSNVSHISRTKNMAAHVLAKHGLSVDHNLFWLEECPDVILNAVNLDVLSLL